MSILEHAENINNKFDFKHSKPFSLLLLSLKDKFVERYSNCDDLEHDITNIYLRSVRLIDAYYLQGVFDVENGSGSFLVDRLGNDISSLTCPDIDNEYNQCFLSALKTSYIIGVNENLVKINAPGYIESNI